jgi:type II secretory pathway pseudopilin PulG
MTTPVKTEQRRRAAGYTLFEILLALGIVAVLLGITVPMVSNSFQETEAETVSKLVEQTVRATHAAALQKGEAKLLGLNEQGLASRSPGIPSAELPKGWKLQVRRFTETRIRRPERGETWEINGAGICEPITLKLSSEKESVTLQFDPLTAQVLPTDD